MMKLVGVELAPWPAFNAPWMVGLQDIHVLNASLMV
jgi:hypothetical protein